LEVQFEGKEITVITPQSPLGQQVMGKKAGLRWTVKQDRRTAMFCLVTVR
jgi:hypothetical protein